MRLRASWMIVPLAAAIGLVGFVAWWLRSRPSLDGVARRIDSGQYRAAEGQLREYLGTFPGDELARLMLARIVVDRAEPDPLLALKLVDGLRPADPHRAGLARAIEGDAYFWDRRYDQAEPAWLEALRIEPTIAEVGWKLLNVYAMQGRDDDSTRLALRLFATETDPRDRVQLLLQLLRQVAHPIEAGSIVHALEPVVKANPGDLHSSRALGTALIRSGRVAEGLTLLRRVVDAHRDDPDAWPAYLDGLIEVGDLDELDRALERVPRSLAVCPRFDAPRGWLASQRLDLDNAAKAYRRALNARPSDPSLAYRLKVALRQGRKLEELAELSPRLDAIARFPDVARDLFDRISSLPDLGLKTCPEVFREAAAALRLVERLEEADAWARIADDPSQRLPSSSSGRVRRVLEDAPSGFR